MYEFGYLVPFLVIYLAYKRIGRIPLEVSGVDQSYLKWVIAVLVFLVLPIHLVRMANPD